MNVAIMQPYFFPYLGYFNLIHACGKFVFLDNVQHISRGFINRNRILIDGKPHMFTIPLSTAPRSHWINERKVADGFEHFTENFFLMLKHAYAKAPYFNEVREMVANVFTLSDGSLSRLCQDSIFEVCHYVGLERKFMVASEIMDRKESLSINGSDKIIRLAKIVGATRYINSMGGYALYSPEDFVKAGIELRFIKSNLPEYRQFNYEFVSHLSILDVLMFVSPEKTKEMFSFYSLVRKRDDTISQLSNQVNVEGFKNK